MAYQNNNHCKTGLICNKTLSLDISSYMSNSLLRWALNFLMKLLDIKIDFYVQTDIGTIR